MEVGKMRNGNATSREARCNMANAQGATFAGLACNAGLKTLLVAAAACLALCLSAALAPSQAYATGLSATAGFGKGSTFTVGGNKYKVTDYDIDEDEGSDLPEVMLVKYGSSKKKATVNTVKYKGITFEVDIIGKNAFNNAKGHKVTSVTIGRHVDRIQTKAFYGCKKLKAINMAKSDIIDIDKGRNGYYLDDSDIAKAAFSKAGVKGAKVKCGSSNATYKKLFKNALKKAGMRSDVKVVK